MKEKYLLVCVLGSSRRGVETGIVFLLRCCSFLENTEVEVGSRGGGKHRCITLESTTLSAPRLILELVLLVNLQVK